MFKHILTVSFLIFATAAGAQVSALGQLQETADKNASALTTDSADNAKSAAAQPFDGNNSKNTKSLDDILSGDPSAPRSAHASAALDKIEKQPLSSYNADNEEALLQQAAKNKKENRLAAERAAQENKGPDMAGILAEAVAGVLTEKIMSDMGGKKTGGAKAKSASSGYKLDCRAQCSSGGCSWGGETFTDPATGREACICGCNLGR